MKKATAIGDADDDDRDAVRRPRLSMASASNNGPTVPTTTVNGVFLDHLAAYTSDAADLDAAFQLLDKTTRFCKSCRKSLDVFRDFDGALKTCRLCLRVRRRIRNAGARYGGRMRGLTTRRTAPCRSISIVARKRKCETRRLAEGVRGLFNLGISLYTIYLRSETRHALLRFLNLDLE